MQPKDSEGRESAREKERSQGEKPAGSRLLAGVLEGGNDSDFAVSIFYRYIISRISPLRKRTKRLSWGTYDDIYPMSSMTLLRVFALGVELDQPLRFSY